MIKIFLILVFKYFFISIFEYNKKNKRMINIVIGNINIYLFNKLLNEFFIFLIINNKRKNRYFFIYNLFFKDNYFF